MFHDIVEPSIRVGNRKGFAVPLSIVTHGMLVVVALLIPLMAPAVLPAPAGGRRAGHGARAGGTARQQA